MIRELARQLNRSLSIGHKTIEKRLVMSPMAFIGNIAFRELVSIYGGYGLLFSEMCSAKRIPRENRHTSSYFKWRDEECPHLVCQIFGADPDIMAEAARRIEQEGFFGVDINFGCSDGSICRQNCGVAVLKTPDLATRIVAAVRKAVSIPLFVKFRLGWKDDPQPSREIAQRFEDAGADALTFHPRIAPDRRVRPPKWEYIGAVKQSVSIPVFGNGNVFDQHDCAIMLQSTGCDGVAIGRIAIARPWVFAEWTENFKPGPQIFLESALQLARLLETHYDSTKAFRRFKRFAFYFAANFQFGHTLYTRISNAHDMTAAKDVLHAFFDTTPEMVQRPNMNFFS
ncbi:MAG: tRNA-dihydrouridine synthase family protein [Desulfobacterales bacterium]|nr:MAG: tRNA-dihydrouridine synthase family protein [Desulfobacterales bacterium]